LSALRTGLVLLASLTLAACATPATRQGMSLGAADIISNRNAALKGAVVVTDVKGGKSTSPLWTSQVDNKGFREALEESLGVMGYLATKAEDAAYRIEAELQELQQPIIGMTFDVDSRVEYRVDGGSGRRVFPVSARGSATVSDAFFGVERLRIANERSVKENIRLFIQQLTQETP